MTAYFLDFDCLTASGRSRATGRQRKRLSHTLYRLCEARNEATVQNVGGGSSAPVPVCAPRTQRRTSARKPASDDSDDSDGDGPEPRYSISASSHEGFGVETPDGRRATLAVVDADGNILEAGPGVARQAWTVAIESYRNFLKGEGYLRVLSKPSDQLNRP